MASTCDIRAYVRLANGKELTGRKAVDGLRIASLNSRS
jgi:hypothetical protein